MFKLFLALSGAAAVARSHASLKRAATLAFWFTMVFVIFIGVSVFLIHHDYMLDEPYRHDMNYRWLSDIAIFYMVWGSIFAVVPAFYGFIAWIYFSFLSLFARAKA